MIKETKIGGSFTLGSAGIHQIPLEDATCPPKYLRFTVTGRVGINETTPTFSYGATDGTKSFCKSSLGLNSSTKPINHYVLSGGVPTIALSASIVSMTVDSGYGFTLDVSTPNTARQVTVEYE